jgi:fructose-bisphosphate aldolase, class II
MRSVEARSLLAAAREGRYALAAFNVANLETTQAVLAAAEASKAPVMLQLSPGAIAYAGYATLRRLVADLADAASVPVLMHLDHARDPDAVARALDDGFDSVMFDGSRLSYAENVAQTARLVGLARRYPGVAVEAEIGVIGGSEDVHSNGDAMPRARPEEVRAFVDVTDVDIVAPALGNLHRMPDDSTRLDGAFVASIAGAADRPIALHGASGIARHQLRELVGAGITKVNVSSRVSRALAAGISEAWQDPATRADLRRFLGAGRDRVREMAQEYLRLSGSEGKAAAGPGQPGWTAVVTEAE